MKMEMQLRGIDGVIATLNSLPAEVVSKRGGPVKTSLAKGARLLRDKVKANLRRSIAEGPTTRSTGGLEDRIIATRGKKPHGTKGERYLVRVKPGGVRHPSGDYVNADGVRTNPLMTANLMEYGSVHQPARPFLRPAVQHHGDDVIRVVTDDLRKRVDDTVTKLAAKNKGRG